MNKMKRLAAMLLAVVLFVGLLPATMPEANAAISTSTFATKVQEFISDSRWKNGIVWADAQKPKLSKWSSTGCCAYAADFVAYVYGSTNAAWTSSDFTKFTNLNEIRAGDIIHTSNHWFVVLERNGNTFRTAEGNFDDKTRVCTDGWGIKNGKIYNLKATDGERTFEYGYHYNFSDGSTNTTYSSSQIYHNIDMSAAVLASRTNQQVSGDCAVVSMATVEAFMYGVTSTADKKTVYNALVSKNGDNDYAYWSNCGYVSNSSIDWEKVYDNLSKGYPVIVHRPASGSKVEHWAVVAGYKGSTTTLEKDKFIIVDVYHGSGGTDIYTSGAWRGSVSIDRMVTRKNGIAITSLSGIKMAINHPAPVHQYGEGHGVYGYVTSNSNLTSVQVKVTNASGTAVYNKTLTPNAKSYLIYNLDSEMTFAKWAKGKYTYTVTAKTASASRTYQYSFEIASGYPVTEAQQSYVFAFNANGGTGAPASQTVSFDGMLHIPAATPTRKDYTFLGWYAMRNGDQTWYCGGNGWNTEAQIAASGYTKKLYPTDTDFIINNSWLSGCMDTTGFTFYAVWEKNAPITYTVSYNANGGSGAPAAQIKTAGTALTLSSTKPTRTGYTFKGWATSASGSVAYQPGSSFTTDANTTLYAVWEKNAPITYTVSYNANGGSGAPAAQIKTAGTALTLSSTKPTRTGYTFKGWATSASGSVAYQPGSSFTTDANTTLYAVWEKNVSATNAQIVVSSGEAMPGEAITVTIALKNNPGIASLKLRVSYGDMLTLTDISYNTAIGGMSQQPQTMASPVTLNWFNGIADSTGDWTFATLTFVVSETAQAGDTADITVTYNADDVYNIADKNVAFAVVNGTVEVADYMPGDINADGTVNNRDLTRLFQYLSDWNVEVNEPALDVNGDGSINNRDLTRLFQYLSDWNVEIH